MMMLEVNFPFKLVASVMNVSRKKMSCRHDSVSPLFGIE